MNFHKLANMLTILNYPVSYFHWQVVYMTPILLGLIIINSTSIIESVLFPRPRPSHYIELRPFPKIITSRKLAAKPKTIVNSSTQSTASIDDAKFEKYAQKYSVNSELLKKIAKCESGFNPQAQNGPYGGMFQFHPSTWVSTRVRMGENTDANNRYNDEEAIKTAAFKISQDGTNAWPVCGKA